MKLTDDLPKWIAMPLRLVLYVFVMFILFNIALGFVKSNVINNTVECSAVASKKEMGLKYAKNMVACLRQKNGFFENLLMGSVYRAIDAMPNVPKEFVGTWDASQPRCNYRHTLEENGDFTSEPRDCSLSLDTFHGTWGVYDNQMIWLAHEGMVWPPDINPIDTVNKDFFLLVEQDGSRTKFSRVNVTAAASPPIIAVDASSPNTAAFPAILSGRDMSLPPDNCFPLQAVNSARLYCLDKSIRRWDLTAGKEDAVFPASLATGIWAIVETAKGVLFIAADKVTFVTPENNTFTANLNVTRNKPRAIVLPDQSVVIVGGRATNDTWLNATERVTYKDGKLTIERLPDLPGSVRTNYSLVALADGRVMALGGTDSKFIGCSPCIADTYILDLRTGTWKAGPKMTEPRADASATLLPDGSVLVAGGWTPAHGWGGAGSRTVEHWDPVRNAFVKSKTMLVTNVAMHQALWAAGESGKRLLLAGGNSAAVQAYDVDTGIWRLVGEFCQGTQKGKIVVAAGVANGQHFLIKGSDGSETCGYESGAWGLVQLRLSGTVQHFDPETGVTLFRSRFAFLPGEGDAPSLVLGGQIHAGMNTYVITAAVDAIWPDGRIEALPAFNYARSDAKVSRTADGSVWLIDGQLNVGGYDHTIEDIPNSEELLPADVPLEQARWIAGKNISAPGLTKHSVRFGESPRNSPLPLGRERVEESDYGRMRNIVRKNLPNGRVIVAGGSVREHRVALLTEDAMQSDTGDEYVEIGEMLPPDTYDIFEPATGAWRQSTPSRGKGGVVAVLDDGRVACYAQLAGSAPDNRVGESSQPEAILEISSADGKSWSAATPEVRLGSETNLFVHQGELFVAGVLEHSDTGMLQWFNNNTQHWETLWQANPRKNWREHNGLIIVRELGNGKRVVLPVAGL